jgi:predicted metal-dependent hydrolase
MATRIWLGEIPVDVVKKDIKNLHLSVHPPGGKVTISAPLRMRLDTIRVFAITRLGWIKGQQKKLRDQEREPQREYLDRESHYVWGRRYLLHTVERDAPPSVNLKHDRLVLNVRSGSDEASRRAILDAWYRAQLREDIPPLIAQWQPRLRVKVDRIFIRRMKTKWGSCNPAKGAIRLNTDLAKKPRDCLEYILVHEMVHLLEPTHNARFVALMDHFMPSWRHRREALNRLPVSHEDWSY